MTPIKLLREGLNVEPMLQALAEHDYLWDQRTGRTEHPDSPHHGLSDIWCRFAPAGSGANMPHQSIWYEDVSGVLPIKELAQELLHTVLDGELGGVLITRIPPGAICKPHRDLGWHALQYEKIAVQLAGNERQAFCFKTARLVTFPGDVFWFNNQELHWVTNDSTEDRMTAIFCIRPFSNKE